jgi:hypothetical protein
MCKVLSLYRVGSLKMAAQELWKCKFDLLGVEEVIRENSGTEWAKDYTFFYEEGNEDHQSGTGIFIHKRIISAVKRELVSDRTLWYIK